MCYNENMQNRIKLAIFALVLAVVSCNGVALAISDEQRVAIKDHCAIIKDNLKDLQRRDSRTRVYLGRYYEILYNKFIVPLNIRLVENNLSGLDFINNQNEFNRARSTFVTEYVEYQRVLEDLVGTDCKTEPERFYDKLVMVREKRAAVAGDVTKLRKLAAKHVSLVKELEVKL